MTFTFALAHITATYAAGQHLKHEQRRAKEAEERRKERLEEIREFVGGKIAEAAENGQFETSIYIDEYFNAETRFFVSHLCIELEEAGYKTAVDDLNITISWERE